MPEIKVSLPKEYIVELTSDLKREFGDDVRFAEELKKIWIEDALKILYIICKGMEIYEKVRKYLKRKQEEGFPIKKID